MFKNQQNAQDPDKLPLLQEPLCHGRDHKGHVNKVFFKQ